MTTHRRIPAIVAIGVTALAALGVFAATGQFRSTDLAHASLEELERKIVGNEDPAVWMAYGDKLRDADRFDAAAKAYQHALKLQPDLAKARMMQGVSLGQGKNPDAFFDFVGKLSMSYPKMALELMERPEVSAMHSDPRWEPAESAARAQAVD